MLCAELTTKTCNNADGIWTSLISLQYVKTTQNLSYFPRLECHKNGLDKKISNHLHVHWLLSLHNYPNAQENKLLRITWQVSHFSTKITLSFLCVKNALIGKNLALERRGAQTADWWSSITCTEWLHVACYRRDGQWGYPLLFAPAQTSNRSADVCTMGLQNR